MEAKTQSTERKSPVQSEHVSVVDVHGTHATAETLSEKASMLHARLEDGRTLLLPRSALQPQQDGSYSVPYAFEDVLTRKAQTDEAKITIPLIEERLELQKRVRDTGKVRVSKRVHQDQIFVDELLVHDEVRVEHVPVNQYVQEPVAVRYEDDTIIVPVLEEVVVTEKRLLLREELHITRRQVPCRHEEVVTLKREEAIVERIDIHKDREPRKG